MKALILIDIQHDFLPGGPLAVGEGDQVVPVANHLMPAYAIVVATQDWHPANHASFASQNPGCQPGQTTQLAGQPQILWPDHCVQGTAGAAFASALDVARIHHVVRKGTDRWIDSYSGFFDNARRRSTGLDEYLWGRGVDELDLIGLATDYCVKFTALDAVSLGFHATVLTAGVRAVELRDGDGQRALQQLRQAGVSVD